MRDAALLAKAKKEIRQAWVECKKGEKTCIGFGQICYEWQEPLRKEGWSLRGIYKDSGIPRQSADRWVKAYLQNEGLLPTGPDRAKTNADIINALVNRLLNLQKAIRKIETDWQGWAESCPEEMVDLREKIRQIGQYFLDFPI